MRRLPAVLALALATSIAACGKDSGTSPSASLVGLWNLSTVNGAPLPFTVRESNPKIEVLDDRITWAADGTFAEAGTARYTDVAGVVKTSPYTDTGTWKVDGSTITIRYASDGASLSGPISGSSLTVAGFGLSQVYVKQ